MAEPVLSINDLTVVLSRDGRASRVLDGVSLEAAPGEVVAIVGESGSGKSSLGLALQGLLPGDSRPRVSGSIRISGVEIVGADRAALRAARRALVRAIPQDPMGALDPTMIVRRQMAESNGGPHLVNAWLRRTGLADPHRIAEALPHRLSGGQRQRVLIAMAMMAKPKLLVADEPTTALDVTTQAQILDLLRELAREAKTATLFITHDLGVAAALADRVLVLYAGRIAEIGRVRDLMRNPAHPYTAGLLASRFDLRSDRRRPLPTLLVERGPASAADNACAYFPRCPLAQPDCASVRPPLRPSPLEAGGLVACLHAEQTSSLVQRAASMEPWPLAAARGEVALNLAGVSKSFARGGSRQRVRVLQSIDLSIRQGECVALVGESGAGKTTLLRIAAGLLSPDAGVVVRDGAPQIVFQDALASLTPWLSIGEQIGERLRRSGLPRNERNRRVREALDLVGLDPALMHALPAELSGGQAQRAVIARAVIVPPKLLLCDEPISATDVSIAAATLNLLGGLRRRLGMAMLFVTHDLAAARIIADRIAVLDNGRLIEDGDAESVIAAPRTAYTRSLIAAVASLHPEPAR
ncbi:MAG TPA: ABC transporter ATP-binding protein [Devosia sp.]|nr:ABC transporter ATP-binding protein [Devosia sp.]